MNDSVVSQQICFVNTFAIDGDESLKTKAEDIIDMFEQNW